MCACTYAHANARAYARTYPRAHVRALCTRARECERTRERTRVHTGTRHADVRARTHADSHTGAPARARAQSPERARRGARMLTCARTAHGRMGKRAHSRNAGAHARVRALGLRTRVRACARVLIGRARLKGSSKAHASVRRRLLRGEHHVSWFDIRWRENGRGWRRQHHRHHGRGQGAPTAATVPPRLSWPSSLSLPVIMHVCLACCCSFWEGEEARASASASSQEHALAIGITTASTADIRRENKGIAVENTHYLKDDLWLLRAIE
eukprot:6173466-Pleurochrysis_carterae.AAC.2